MIKHKMGRAAGRGTCQDPGRGLADPAGQHDLEVHHGGRGEWGLRGELRFGLQKKEYLANTQVRETEADGKLLGGSACKVGEECWDPIHIGARRRLHEEQS